MPLFHISVSLELSLSRAADVIEREFHFVRGNVRVFQCPLGRAVDTAARQSGVHQRLWFHAARVRT